MKWQIIDSAPLNGEIIDLWVRFCGTEFRLTDCHYDGQWWYEDSETGGASVYGTPTHWIPRPVPPGSPE